MRKKNENVALTLEERNIECANEWKTFGTIRNVSAPSTTQLSKIYANQKGRIQIRVCPDFGPLKVNEMGKMLAAMTKFRNVCAHNDRLVPVFEQKNRTPSQRRPYKNTIVFMILYLLYEQDSKMSTDYKEKT